MSSRGLSCWLTVASCLTVASTARAVPPCDTEDSATIAPHRAGLEASGAPGDLSLAVHTGVARRLQAGASFPVEPRAFAPDHALDLKWRLVEWSDDSALAVRVARVASGDRHRLDTTLALSASGTAWSADVNSGVVGSETPAAFHSSALFTLPAQEETLVALELVFEAATADDVTLSGKAALVQAIGNSSALSLDLAPRRQVGAETEVTATVAIHVGVDFELGRGARRLTETGR